MSAQKTIEVAEQIVRAHQQVADAIRATPDFTWHCERIREYIKGLFDRAPFQVGDRVRLNRTPVITESTSWGWLGSKHFLVAGALAVVREVDFIDGQFTGELEFDDETYLPSWGLNKGIPEPVRQKSWYRFNETFIEKVLA